MGVGIYALGLVAMPGTEHIIPHENLTAGPRTRTNANGRNGEGASDVLAELTGHGFEHDGKCACVFECPCGSDEGIGGCGGAALHAVAREGGGALWEEANVGHDGYAHVGESGDVWGEFLAALELYGLDVALLDDANGGTDCVGGAGSVGAKGHVGDEEGCGRTASDCAAVVEHLVKGEMCGRGIAETDLGERVADEGDVDGVGGAGACGGKVVRGEDRDRDMLGAQFADARDRCLLRRRHRRHAHMPSEKGRHVTHLIGPLIGYYIPLSCNIFPRTVHLHSTMPDSDNDDIDSVVNDENVFDHPTPRSSSVFTRRTPFDTPLCDITDQFFHPPSPSPVRISKLKHAVDPPRRPKKPKSLAYPADPPNWFYSRSSSSLPPSSPFAFPPSDQATARYEYHLGTPSKASDPDPFGFVAVERALKAKRVPPTTTTLKSPPRSIVLPSAPFHAHVPLPTNNEDIEGLYADEPVAGPSHVPVAPLLLMNSDQPLADVGAQPTFPDPLRTPRKRKRRASPTSLPDEEDTDVPSSPSPVKVSVRAGTHRCPSSHTPVPKLTRAQARAAAMAKPPTAQSSRTKRVKTSFQHIPTPSSTPASARSSSRRSTAPPTPVPPRRSTRQAAVGARVNLGSVTSDAEDGRMKLRSRSKVNGETKPATRAAPKSKASTKTTTAAKPTRGRPKGKSSTKDTKGKGKARPLESVLDLSDDTREVRTPTMWQS